MTRVLLDCRMASWTGVGRYTRSLTRALAARDDVQVIQLIAPGEEPPAMGAEAVECGHYPLSPVGMVAFGQAVSRIRPDLTHCLHFPTPSPIRHPLVVTIHDLIPLEVPGVMPSRLRREAFRLFVARAVRAADRIIVPSTFTERAVAAFHPPAVSRLRVTLEAADDFCEGPVGELPSAVRSLERYVLAFGSVKRHKRVGVLLDAWQVMLPLLPGDVSLVLVGSPTSEYHGHPLSRDPQSRVVWVAGVEDEQLRALYASAAAFVFPSVYEGFGLPPLEAMGCGTPIVACAVASLPEVVGDGGVLVPPDDPAALAVALQRLLTDPHLAAEMTRRGFEQSARFTAEATAAATVDVYRELVGLST